MSFVNVHHVKTQDGTKKDATILLKRLEPQLKKKKETNHLANSKCGKK